MTTKQVNFIHLYKDFLPDIDKTHGTERLCRSPFREDKHPSFCVNVESGLWKDFGTNEGGNATQFYARAKNMSTKAAYKEVLRLYSNEIANSLPKTAQNRRKTAQNAQPTVIPTADIQRFIERLQNGDGYYPKFLRERFRRRSIEPEVCRQLHVGITDDDYTLFAYQFDLEGNCTHYKKIRHEDGAKNRYIFNSESRLFPASMLHHDTIVLCEGETDMLALLSNGINAITNTAGAGTFKEEWALQLAGKNVIILYDNDEAGRNGVRTVAQHLSKTVQSLTIAHLPDDCNDVCAFFEQGGTSEQLHEILLKAAPFEAETPTPQAEEPVNHKKHQSFEAITIFSDSGRLIHRAVADVILSQNDLCASENGSTTVFYEYKDGFWQQISSRIIRKLIQDVIGDVATHSHIRSVLEIIADRVYVDAKLLDTRDDLINLHNTAFDLAQCKPVAHNSAHYFTHKTSYSYNTKADCPEFHAALRTYSMNDEAWVQAFWEILGYTLTGKYEFQKMFWFFGGGANGKGTVLRVMQNLVGTFYTRASIQPKQLDDQFYKSGLINKRLAIAGEIPPKLANISAIKELSGGDRQSTDVKFGQQIDFENKAKLVFAMNRMPTFPANEPIAPILRRIYLLPFEHRITTINPNIEQQFEAELPGIFNHAIQGLKRLRVQRGFTPCERGTRQLDLYAGEINTFAAFVSDRCAFGSKHTVWGYELWEDYQAYMNYHCSTHWQNNHQNITTIKAFFRELSANYDVEKKIEHCRQKAGKMLRLYGVEIHKSRHIATTR